MSATVSIVFAKSRETKQGYPIKLRITYQRKSYYLGLNTYLTESDFNKLKTNKRLNPELRSLKEEFAAIELKASGILSKMKSFSFKAFKEKYYGIVPNNMDSLSYCFDAYINELKRAKKLKTATIYESTLSSIKSYRSALLITDIDKKFLEAYKIHLLGESKSITTISIYFRCLRSIVNKNRDLMADYPFRDFKVPSPENNKRAINENDLFSLLKYESPIENDNLYLDLFKFSYYSGGANIKDILLLKRENIHNGTLMYKRAKTRKPIKVYLLPESMKLIDKYSGQSDKYLFPFLKNEEPEYLLHRVHAIVKRVNKRIERACATLDIDKVTTYSARHSFATVLMNKGASLAFISQSLGHTNISTTQSYLGSFTDSQMEENMRMLT